MSQPSDVEDSATGIDDITITDYDSAILDEEPLPNSQDYMGGTQFTGYEHGAPDRPSLDDRKEAFKSRRLKSGWTPPSEKVAALPATGTKIPTIDEWLDFFSRMVVGVLTDLAIEFAFRGVDEELLSDREVNSIRITPEERERIAKPFAEFAYKNSYMRKHGREIIGFAGSIDAMLQLVVWYTRMTKIAMKYQRMSGNPRPQRFRRPSRAARQHVNRQERMNQQRVVVIQPDEEVNQDERTGPSEARASQNGHEREWRPDVGGPVFNPGG